MKAVAFLPGFALRRFLVPTALLVAVGSGWLTSVVRVVLPGLLLGGMCISFFVVLVFQHPRIGIITYTTPTKALGANSRLRWYSYQ